RVAGGEDDARGQLGPLAAQSLEEFPSAHPRHADVGDDDVEVPLCEQPERLAPVRRAVSVDAAAAEEAQQRVAQRGLVVDDEHREGPCRGRGWRGGRLRRRARVVPGVLWQGYEEARTGAGLRLHPDAAAVLLRDAVADRQAEARAHAFRLRGEERVEDLAADLGRYAGARVRDFEHGVALASASADGDPAGRLDRYEGLLGVDQEVQQQLLQLRRVG